MEAGSSHNYNNQIPSIHRNIHRRSSRTIHLSSHGSNRRGKSSYHFNSNLGSRPRFRLHRGRSVVPGSFSLSSSVLWYFLLVPLDILEAYHPLRSHQPSSGQAHKIPPLRTWTRTG